MLRASYFEKLKAAIKKHWSWFFKIV